MTIENNEDQVSRVEDYDEDISRINEEQQEEEEMLKSQVLNQRSSN